MYKLIIKISILFLLKILCVSFINAQCIVSNFNVNTTNGTCYSNGVINIEIPGAVNCSGWNVILTPPTGSEIYRSISSGMASFNNLPAGSYSVRLFNGINTISWSNNPIILTTSYREMNISHNITNSTCPVNSPNYIADANLSILVSGGTGPFVYEVITRLGTQTSPQTTNRNYTFNNIPHPSFGKDTIIYSVIDKSNGDVGCEIQKTFQTHLLYSPGVKPNLIRFRRQKKCTGIDCDSYVLQPFIFHDGPASTYRTETLRFKIISGPNAGLDTILSVISGSAPGFVWESYHPWGRYFEPVNVKIGDVVNISYTTNCWDTLTRNFTVNKVVNPIFANGISYRKIDTTSCDYIYEIRAIAFSDANYYFSYDAYSMYCYGNTEVTIFKEIPASSGVFIAIDTLDSISSNVIYKVSSPGTYRVKFDDGCDSAVSQNITVPPITNPFINTVLTQGVSYLEGTSGIQLGLNTEGGSNLPIYVELQPTSGATSKTFYTNYPDHLKGSYTINFPYIYSYTENKPYLNLENLPPDEYRVKIYNACNDSFISIINLQDTAKWNPSHSVSYNCNESQMKFDMGINNFVANWSQIEVKDSTTNATIVSRSSPESSNNRYYSGVYTLASGSYYLEFINAGMLYTNQNYFWSVAHNKTHYYNGNITARYYFDIPPYEDIVLSIKTILCTDTTGVVNITIAGGTPVYPLIYNLYNFNRTSLLKTDTIQSDTSSRALGILYSNLDTGDYVINVISGYDASTPNGCYSLDQNVTVNYSQNISNIISTDSIICIENNTVQIGTPLDTAYWNISWYDGLNNQIGVNVNPITLNPMGTNFYKIEYFPKSRLGCFNTTIFKDTIGIVVVQTPDTNKIVEVEADTVCSGLNALVYVLNADSGTIYELFQNNISLPSPLIDTCQITGDTITFILVDNILNNGSNVFQIMAQNGFCDSVLVDSVEIWRQSIVPPIAICKDTIVYLDSIGEVRINPSYINDGSYDKCLAISLGLSKHTFTCADTGVNLIRLYVQNDSGYRDTCQSQVTVIDTIKPIVKCQNIFLNLDINGQAFITPSDIDGGSTDNCTIASLVISQSNFNCSHIGENIVTLLVTDISGNKDSCQAVVTIQDNTNPVIICPSNQSDTTINECKYIIKNYTESLILTDNCSAQNFITITQNPFPGIILSLNEYITNETISLTATDASGNSTICSFNVTIICINDLIIPEFISPNGDGKNDIWIIENLEKFGQASVMLFNRWGSLVYSESNYSNNWDATYSKSIGIGTNKKLPPGTYYYILKIKKGGLVYNGFLQIQE